MKPFVYFGASHVAALAVIPVASSLLIAFARGRVRRVKCMRWSLAALLAVNWSLWMLLLYTNGWLGVGNGLPLNLCDWATIATILCLLDPVQQLYELSFFWAFCGTLQALISPDSRFDFPDRQFVLFFVYHGAIIVSVLFLTFAARMRPYLLSLGRVTGWSLLYAAAAGLADWTLGTNYGFLRAKPAHLSLLDFMAPWPWYLPELFGAGIFFMLLWYAPFAVADLVQGRKLGWHPA
jgi:hypothetical integral membrane protein (TIGR02206 family)